jgi:hypothetical protein
MFDTVFGRYSGRDWLALVVWFIAACLFLSLFRHLDGGSGYGIIAVLAMFFALTRQELIRLRSDLEELKAESAGTGAV